MVIWKRDLDHLEHLGGGSDMSGRWEVKAAGRRNSALDSGEGGAGLGGGRKQFRFPGEPESSGRT